MEENSKTRLILGIDISTACLGVSLVKVENEDIEVLKISYVTPKAPKNIKGTEALFLKSKYFKEEFIDQYKDVGLTDIIIEEPLHSSQNNNTVVTLLRFNGMISQSIYEATGIVPKYISSYDARKYSFPELMAVRKYNKKDKVRPLKDIQQSIAKNELVLFGGYPFSCQKKYIIWNKVSEKFPDIEWVYNSKNNLKTENFDVSDSLVCILGYLNMEKYKNSPDAEIVCCSTTDNLVTYAVRYWDGSTFEKKIQIEDVEEEIKGEET